MRFVSEADYRRLRLAQAEDAAFAESIRIKTQCADCGYQSCDIYPSQRAMCPCRNCTGAMVVAYKRAGEGRR